MCHSDDSRAPGPPQSGEVGEQGELTLAAADGNEFAAYRARPAQDSRVGMVILPDVRGLHPFYTDLAQRFAEAGFATIAIDYFGRTTGTNTRDESFDWQQHIGQVTPVQIRADVGAAVSLLRDERAESVFTVGFCFGGGNSWRLAASDLGFAGNIGFYGKPAHISDVIGGISSPILMLVAGADAATPLEDFKQVDEKLTAAGKVHEIYVYEGAPHSFFDRAFAEWQDACSDAWERILVFTQRHAQDSDRP